MDAIDPNTDGGIDPSPMKQAMYTFLDRATQMLTESINYAGLMMFLEPFAIDVHIIV